MTFFLMHYILMNDSDQVSHERNPPRQVYMNKGTGCGSPGVKTESCKMEGSEDFSPTWILFQKIESKIPCTFKNWYYTAFFFDSSEFTFNRFSGQDKWLKMIFFLTVLT